jgi:hypothetical protein
MCGADDWLVRLSFCHHVSSFPDSSNFYIIASSCHKAFTQGHQRVISITHHCLSSYVLRNQIVFVFSNTT